jgi:ABC-type multidrug transport system ATPase subunit
LRDRHTILAVSHQLGQTRRLIDRVVILSEGQVAGRLGRKELRDAGTFQTLLEDLS